MEGYRFIDEYGTFRLKNPEMTSYLYFPIANEYGVMSSVTPTLGGDSKMGQNTFLLAPVSSEDLHNNKSSRNFWCNIKGKGIWSATGKSADSEALKFTEDKEVTRLEAGLMWHKITRTSKQFGITSEILSFVPALPCEEPVSLPSMEQEDTSEPREGLPWNTVELMRVTLKNTGSEELELTPTAAIPLYGRSADNIRDHRHVTSLLQRAAVTDHGVLLNPTLTFDERGHRKNAMVYGVFGSTGEGSAPVGFYPCVEDFIGEGGSLETPRAIYTDSIQPVQAGAVLEGYETLGGIRFETITLKPQETGTYIFVLGYGSSCEELCDKAAYYLSEKAVNEAFLNTRAYWIEKQNIKYETGLKDFDCWMQWVNFQPVLRRIYGCSFLPHHDYGKGGRGWRDLWQDCLALLLMNTESVRDMIIHNFAGVRLDGSNATIIGSGQGEFIADRNNITRVWMDHGIWPLITTALYIMQSGDINILLKENYYFKDPQSMRGEEKDTLWQPEAGNRVKTGEGKEYTGTLLEHLLLENLTAFYDVGEHNHIRLRGADWNDALDMAKERGESVAFTAQYGDNLEQLAELLLLLNKNGADKINLLKEIEPLLAEDTGIFNNHNQKKELLYRYCLSVKHRITGERIELAATALADNLKRKAEWIKSHIRNTEWVKDQKGYSWFNSYYDNNGNPVEGETKAGVRMMLTGQVFTIMSGTATVSQIKDITAAADQYLYDASVGGYRLNTDFKEVKIDLGRMFGFAYGSKENGSVFSHMAVMYANALYKRNFVKEGYKAIHSLYRHCIDFEKTRIYPGIPEYIGSNGRGLYHYLTGSASWLLLTVLTEMFGVKGKMGNLKLEPKLMLEQFNKRKEAGVHFLFAGHRFRVVYKNLLSKEYGVYKTGLVTIDNNIYELKGRELILPRKEIEKLDVAKEHIIEVELI